jgi:hypothetical protein
MSSVELRGKGTVMRPASGTEQNRTELWPVLRSPLTAVAPESENNGIFVQIQSV